MAVHEFGTFLCFPATAQWFDLEFAPKPIAVFVILIAFCTTIRACLAGGSLNLPIEVSFLAVSWTVPQFFGLITSASDALVAVSPAMLRCFAALSVVGWLSVLTLLGQALGGAGSSNPTRFKAILNWFVSWLVSTILFSVIAVFWFGKLGSPN